jgi:hypothetical protein
VLFFELSTWLLLILLIAVVAGATAIGLLVAKAVRGTSEELREPFSVMQAALLGFMGLVPAFGLSLAVGRCETRRAAVVDESNAIGHRLPSGADDRRTRTESVTHAAEAVHRHEYPNIADDARQRCPDGSRYRERTNPTTTVGPGRTIAQPGPDRQCAAAVRRQPEHQVRLAVQPDRRPRQPGSDAGPRARSGRSRHRHGRPGPSPWHPRRARRVHGDDRRWPGHRDPARHLRPRPPHAGPHPSTRRPSNTGTRRNGATPRSARTFPVVPFTAKAVPSIAEPHAALGSHRRQRLDLDALLGGDTHDPLHAPPGALELVRTPREEPLEPRQCGHHPVPTGLVAIVAVCTQATPPQEDSTAGSHTRPRAVRELPERADCTGKISSSCTRRRSWLSRARPARAVARLLRLLCSSCRPAATLVALQLEKSIIRQCMHRCEGSGRWSSDSRPVCGSGTGHRRR